MRARANTLIATIVSSVFLALSTPAIQAGNVSLDTDDAETVKWLTKKFEWELTQMTLEQVLKTPFFKKMEYEISLDPKPTERHDFISTTASRQDVFVWLAEEHKLDISFILEGDHPTAIRVEKEKKPADAK